MPPKKFTSVQADVDEERGIKDVHQRFSLAFDTSAELMMILYDICFFGTFAIGWTLTYAFNSEFLADNAVIRVFGVHNICIGVDSNPARLVAIPLSYLSIFFFIASAGLSGLRMLAVPGRFKFVRGMLLVLAVPLALGFTWSIGVEPTSAPSLRTHLNGFGIGLIGLSLLKASSVLEFRHTRPHHEGDPFGCRYCNLKVAIFVSTQVFMSGFLLLFSAMLLKGMAGRTDAQITERLNVPASELSPKFDWIGLPLILLTGLSPFVLYWTKPKRSNAKIALEFDREYIGDDESML